MITQVKDHLTQQFPFLAGSKILLATSGGLDSMVMAHLLHHLEYDIALAHCNFQLRGIESFEDQNFVQEYANSNEIPVFITQFDTVAFADDFKVSTQVAARQLRYNWFYELLENEGFDFILTAHHADDNLETFLINLSRGTGLEGLTGIPEQNENIIRPLLPFSRIEIENFAKEIGLKWREDSSNASDKYLRNKIRHHIVPLLKELNPNFTLSFQKTQSYLQQANELVEDASIMVYQQVAKQQEEEIHFDLNQLLKLPNYKTYLYQWLNEFGFSAWEDVYNLVDSQSGKQVFSSEFRLLKDRNKLILSPIKIVNRSEEFTIAEGQERVNIPVNLSISKVAEVGFGSNNAIFVDADTLQFPLLLRRWSEGAIFQPLGLDGKSKKVSKLLKDEKLSIIEKERIWLLYSGESIVWIIGIRQDERFKINPNTTNILKLQIQE